MNWPTILISLIILGIFVAIVARGIYNKKHHRSSCACSCDCGACKGCSSAHHTSS